MRTLIVMNDAIQYYYFIAAEKYARKPLLRLDVGILESTAADTNHC